MAIFSTSDVKTFKKCRQLADFSISARMALQFPRPAIYFTVGSIAHEALERYYNHHENAWEFYRDEAQKALVEWRDVPFYVELEQETLAFTYVLMAYMKRWAPRHDHFNMLNTEVRDIIELPNGHHFTFKYDGLIEKKDGTTWILEFKTTASLPHDLGWLQIDDQASAYQWAIEEVTGLKIYGTIYTWLRKKVPTKPKELVSGGISEVRKLVTTAEVAYETLVELGYSPSDYKSFLQAVVDREGDDFFLRTEVVTSPKQRTLMAKHLNDITTIMGDETTLMYPSPSERNCAKCEFFGPCAAKQLGLNYKALLESDYEKGGYY
jgi:hypothetical protein